MFLDFIGSNHPIMSKNWIFFETEVSFPLEDKKTGLFEGRIAGVCPARPEES
jgi:hypothetical protein